MPEYILPILAFVAGAGGKAVIDWLRFRNLDTAQSDKHRADAYSAIHKSDTDALTVSTTLLASWIKQASEAEATIIELRTQIAHCTCRGNGR